MKYILCVSCLSICFINCTKEIKCSNLDIMPVFVTNMASDVDTLILKKFKANDNFQILIDTFKIIKDVSASFRISNDTTFISISEYDRGIIAGYDWQIFIPKKNRTVFISNITSENKTMKCGTLGEPLGCHCTNTIFSLTKDNQIINFSNNPFAYNYFIYTTL